jgi:hypothetical protein
LVALSISLGGDLDGVRRGPDNGNVRSRFRFLDRSFDLLLTTCYSEARSIETVTSRHCVRLRTYGQSDRIQQTNKWDTPRVQRNLHRGLTFLERMNPSSQNPKERLQ